MNLSVGQVIYAVMKQKAVVYPLLVVTEITEKTMEGATQTYMVRAGADPQKRSLPSPRSTVSCSAAHPPQRRP